MLERPPIATEQEKSDSFKMAFASDIQNVNADYPYWDKVEFQQKTT
jgi:hypothetical protein